MSLKNVVVQRKYSNIFTPFYVFANILKLKYTYVCVLYVCT